MATEITGALRTIPSPWLQQGLSAAFGAAAVLVGTIAKNTSLGLLSVVNTSGTKYYVQVHNKATAPVNGNTPIWVGVLAANLDLLEDFTLLGGLNAPLGMYVAISTTAPTLTYPAGTDAAASWLYAQAP